MSDERELWADEIPREMIDALVGAGILFPGHSGGALAQVWWYIMDACCAKAISVLEAGPRFGDDGNPVRMYYAVASRTVCHGVASEAYESERVESSTHGGALCALAMAIHAKNWEGRKAT